LFLLKEKRKPKKPVTHKNKDYWEEIFDSIDMDYLPLEYINTVVVKFKDGKVWEIDIDTSKHKHDPQTSIEETLAEFFETYEQDITDIDFKLDTDRLKKDIGRRTRRFLKLNK